MDREAWCAAVHGIIKSGLKSAHEFSKIYQIPLTTVGHYLSKAGLHYCSKHEMKSSGANKKVNKTTSKSGKASLEKEKKATGKCLEWTITDSGYWMEG